MNFWTKRNMRRKRRWRSILTWSINHGKSSCNYKVIHQFSSTSLSGLKIGSTGMTRESSTGWARNCAGFTAWTFKMFSNSMSRMGWKLIAIRSNQWWYPPILGYSGVIIWPRGVRLTKMKFIARGAEKGSATVISEVGGRLCRKIYIL